jgi:hypothetical protein
MGNRMVPPFGPVVQIFVVYLIEKDRGENSHPGADRWVSFVDDLPWGFIRFVAIWSSYIEPQGVGSGFLEEVLPAGEGFNFVEFVFDEPMGGFDVGLVGVGSRGDGVVLEAWDGFYDQGKQTWTASVPGADKLRSVIGLESAVFELNAA